jgi:serine palmitoyltransferase
VLVLLSCFLALLLHPAGTSAIHRELEQLVAQYIGQEDAITFGMGFATNAASIPAIAGPGSLVLSDALNHTSIVAGVKASGAKVGRLLC